MNRRQLVLGGLVLVAVSGCKRGSGGAPGAPARPRIAVIPKGTTHEFWKSVHQGAVQASQEENVDIVWKGPLKEDDLRQQIELVQSFVAQRVSAIVLAPLSDTALKNPVRAARDAGIPVVVFDSDLQGGMEASFVATDNRAAGRMAGEYMAKHLTGPSNVVVLRYQEGSASTTHREQGFLEAMAQHPNLRVVSSNQYAGATVETAFSTSESLLAAHKASAGEVHGVFAPNESSTFGMLLALRKAGLAGKIRFVGFDTSDKLMEAVKSRELDAIVVQDPFKIGYLAVKTAAQVLRNQPVERRIDTGARLVE